MITLPKELYDNELVDMMCKYDYDPEGIVLLVVYKKCPMHSETVARIDFDGNDYWIDQFHYRLRDKAGNEIVDNEVKEILINIKNYLDILGFRDITQDEY